MTVAHQILQCGEGIGLHRHIQHNAGLRGAALDNAAQAVPGAGQQQALALQLLEGERAHS